MNTNYLFPNKFKRIGWFIFIPAALLSVASVVFSLEPAMFNIKMPVIVVEHVFADTEFFTLHSTNIWHSLLWCLVIVGGLMVAFSEEEFEDEYISKLRLESLVWAIYINYAILILSIIFVYEIAFLYVIALNMFTVLLFFILRFEIRLISLKKESNNAE